MCEALIECVLELVRFIDTDKIVLITRVSKEIILLKLSLPFYFFFRRIAESVVSLPTFWEQIPSSYVDFHFAFFCDLTIVTFLPASSDHFLSLHKSDELRGRETPP